jgi:hypothetical protein
MSGPVTKWGKADPHRWELANKIASVLHANGSGIRPFYSHVTDLPEGGMLQLVDEVPFAGVRAEMGGVTVSVELTHERTGHVPCDEGEVRFACYDFETFCTWFYNLLRRSGQHPAPVVPINLLHGHYRHSSAMRSTLRPSLSQIRHTPNKKRR